jgi:hypothetical protein
MKIHISEATKLLIENKRYKLNERGKMEIKGRGEIITFFVACKLDEHGKEIKSPYMEVFENLKNKPPTNLLPKDLKNESIDKAGDKKKESVRTNELAKKSSEKKETNKSLGSKKEPKRQDSIKESELVKQSEPDSFTLSQLTDQTSTIPNGVKKETNNPELTNTSFKLNNETMTSLKNIQDEFQNIKLTNNGISSNNNINNKNSNETNRKENVYSIDINSSTLNKQNNDENHENMNNATTQEVSFELNKSSDNYRSDEINYHELNGNISSQSNQNKMLEMPKRSSFLSITCQLI